MLWLKAFHIIAMVCWFAGLFYLPRLFVYHSKLESTETAAYDRFCQMERRLYWGIMTPSAFFTLLLGLGLMHSIHYQWQALPLWLTLKLTLVATLVVFHLYCARLVKKFNRHQNPHSSCFYRWFNEYPVFVLIGAVLLAVLKPY